VTDKDDGRFKEDASASGDRPSRRSFFVAGAALGAATGIDAGSAALAQDRSRTRTQMPSSGEDLVLYNGKVRTMDNRDSVVSAVRIRGNRFAEVGSFDALGPNAINLNGRTVIPGLIESCDHIVSFGNYRPGYHTVLENAMSIAEIQAILAARRAEVPPGEWITALGAWNAFTRFAETAADASGAGRRRSGSACPALPNDHRPCSYQHTGHRLVHQGVDSSDNWRKREHCIRKPIDNPRSTCCA
jgi:hypothetical protein